jgi:hypothetical protein
VASALALSEAAISQVFSNSMNESKNRPSTIHAALKTTNYPTPTARNQNNSLRSVNLSPPQMKYVTENSPRQEINAQMLMCLSERDVLRPVAVREADRKRAITLEDKLRVSLKFFVV